MKTLARSYVWWPDLNQDLENTVKTYVDCNKFGRSVPALKDHGHPWCRPTGPYQRIHMDFAGPFQGHLWLLIQDAHSKWPDIVKMNSTKAGALLKVLRDVFARTGLPCVVLSDNGPQFISDELEVFFKQNGIKHIPIPTYHPK
jgi:transposase InsO family protein